MKIKVDCCFISNRSNGKKCKLGPIVNRELSDCVFKKNGMDPSSGIKQKRAYLSSLAVICKQWHERKNDKVDHFFHKICPQLEEICDQFETKLAKK